MRITDVRIREIDGEGKLRGLASITIEEVFAVHDIKIIEGDKGLFVAMPSKKSPDGVYRDIAHPINRETREQVQKAVLDAYYSATEKE